MTEKILFSLAAICALGFLLLAFLRYIELPVVKYSVSQQKVVAVENFKEEALPLFPLPEKYVKVYVK